MKLVPIRNGGRDDDHREPAHSSFFLLKRVRAPMVKDRMHGKRRRLGFYVDEGVFPEKSHAIFEFKFVTYTIGEPRRQLIHNLIL